MKADEFRRRLKKSSGPTTGICPAHDDKNESLSFKDAGDRLLVKCFAGCQPYKIMAALSLTMQDLFNGPNPRKKSPPSSKPSPLTVAQLSVAKRIPEEFLRYIGVTDSPDGVVVEYRAPDGSLAPRQRLRIAMAGKRFLWTGPKGKPVAAYSLDVDYARQERFTFLVEGESDVWTLAFMGFPAIGIPGADATKTILPEHVTGLDVLYVVKEPDAGGDTFMRRVRERLDEIGWTGRALAISMPDGIKDVSALYLDCRGDLAAFFGRLDKAIVAGLPLEVGVVPEPAAPQTGKVYHLTPMGNSERLVDMFRQALLYVHGWDWLTWSGTKWLMDPGGYTVQRMAKRVVRALHEEAQRLLDEATTDEAEAAALRAMRWALGCESNAKLEEMVKLSREMVLRDAKDFDARPMLFNVQNGTLDLTTGTLRPHDRLDLITQLSPVTFDPAATCPTWERFISDIMVGRPDLIGYLQRLIGHCMTGDTTEQAFIVMYGIGANGKSTLLETLRALFGTEYARQCPIGTLLTKHDSAGGGAASPDVARLRGARLVTAAEPEKGSRLAESIVKAMTGGDTQTARYLFKDFFEFTATFKLMLATNHKPRVSGGVAIWRRVKLIPFDASFLSAPDKAMGQRLRAELPGILNWALAGALEWQRVGLAEPPEVKAATQEYREEEEVLGDFWSECCVFGPRLQVVSATLIERYRNWCAANNEKAMSTTAFGRVLAEQGIKKAKVWAKGKTLQIYQGISLDGLGSLDGVQGAPGTDTKDPDPARHDRDHSSQTSIKTTQTVQTVQTAENLDPDDPRNDLEETK